MIWVGGRIVPNDALKVSVLDRTFEHGLGLFETLRTWGRRAPLLDRHLARMTNSASELRLPLDPASLPKQSDVERLLDAQGDGGDVLLRVTLSGGFDESRGSTVWMRALPLPPPSRRDGAIIDVSWQGFHSDPMGKHKTLNYWARRATYEQARALGFDEALGLVKWEGKECVWEGSRTNVFVVKDDQLLTPSEAGPLVPGIMRGLVIERAAEVRLPVFKLVPLPLETLITADEVFLTNSVRGIIPVARLHESERPRLRIEWPAPGPWSQRLSLAISDVLNPGGPST